MPSSLLQSLMAGAQNLAQNPSGGTAQVAAALVQGDPALEANRERAAAVLDSGFRVYDSYNTYRPWAFAAGLAGMAASGYALYKRRKNGPETITLYTATFVASALITWITRPQPAVPAPAGANASTFSLLGLIDRRRAELLKEDPNFVAKTFARFDALPVVQQQLSASPWLKALAP